MYDRNPKQQMPYQVHFCAANISTCIRVNYLNTYIHGHAVLNYYALQWSLQIQRSVLLDEERWRALYLIYLAVPAVRGSIKTSYIPYVDYPQYQYKFTTIVTQFTLLQVSLHYLYIILSYRFCVLYTLKCMQSL